MALFGHTFIGDGPYCEHWNESAPQGDPETYGVIAFRSQCGYPPESHIRTPTDNGNRFGSGDIPGTPCQPIGCDNGHHLPGCVYEERDAELA